MQLYNRDARSAKLYVFVATASYGRIGLQVLAYEGAQDTVARSM